MDKQSYFLKAMQTELFLRKDWVISAFSVVREKPFDLLKDPYPYQLVMVEGNKYRHYVDPENEMKPTQLGDVVINTPVFHFKDKVNLKAGDLPNLKTPVETTYGNILVNSLILVWPFGSKIDYLNGKIVGEKVDELVAARLVDYPEGFNPDTDDLSTLDPKNIYVFEFLKYQKAVSSLAGFTQLCAPSASPRTMTVDPAVIKRRDELLKEYGDQISDPAILARIQKELADMDKASFANDPGGEFYMKSKSFDVSRMKSFIMYGADTGFGDTSKGLTVIKKSLQEGLDVDNLPAMADGIRAGSYNRGNQTALGGESVKYFYRIFQNTRVAEEDCGVKDGLPWTISELNYKLFIGQYQARVAGKVEAFTEESIKKLIGSKIYIRSPMLCKTEAPSFCARCIGDALSQSPTGLHVAASDVGSIFMNSFMKAMHGKALVTARYDFRQQIN